MMSCARRSRTCQTAAASSVQREFLTSEWVAVFRSTNRARCAESALVLASVGIASRVDTAQGQSQVLVTPDQVARAMHQLFLYGEENRGRHLQADRQPRNVHSFALPGVLLFLLITAALGDCALIGAFGRDWFAAGNLSLAALQEGEWWRTLTALTLHRDLAHLLGNGVFGALFGLLVGRAMGPGLGWLAIVLAGAAGNLASLPLSPAGVASVGASTAVFAALGMLGSWSWMTRAVAASSRMQRWLPWLACLTLFALTAIGGDPSINVAAHVCGFATGALAGVVLVSLPRRVLWSAAVQAASGAAAVLLLGGAWLLALV